MKQLRTLQRTFLGLFLLTEALVAAQSCADTCPPLPPETWTCRDRAIWEQPVCPCPTGRPISYGRLIEGAVVNIKPYGYVKWEGYWDTRQIAGFRDGQVLLFPLPRKLDPFGIDINSHGLWQMTAIETRLGLALYGPEWHCLKTDGLIEGDFRGINDSTIATFRLRHAFGRISWGSGSFLFGQWWHPLYIIECFPHTVAFNIGAPMDPQAREPQLRLTQRWKWFELIVALAGQRDYASNGPFGVSTEYLINSATPNLHLQIRAYGNDDNNVVGMAADYLRLCPRIESLTGYSVNEHLGSFTWEAFGACRYAPWSLRSKVFWAQNGNDQLLISGFGVATVHPVTDQRTYTNTAAVGAWLDFSYLFGCDDTELGFFVGGTKNLGSRNRLFIDPNTQQPIVYALTRFGPNLDYVWRVSPRFVFKRDPIRFGAEFEVTTASFGPLDTFGKVTRGTPVTGYRILLALYYMF